VFCIDNVSFSKPHDPINGRKNEGKRNDQHKRPSLRKYFCKEIMRGENENRNDQYEDQKFFHNKRLQKQPPLVSFLNKEDKVFLSQFWLRPFEIPQSLLGKRY
jgi:hypothetical protein